MKSVTSFSRRGFLLTAGGGLIAASALEAPGAMAADAFANLRAKGVIRIGNGIFGTKPYVWQEDGHYHGFEHGLLLALLKKLQIANFKYVITDWTTLIPGLKADRWDIIMCGMMKDAQRVEGGGIAMSRPYAFIHDLIIVKEDSPLKTVASLKGKALGSVVGTTDSLVAQSLVDRGIAARVRLFNTYGEPFLALQQGRIDAVILDQLTYKGQQEHFKNMRVVGQPLDYIATPKWKGAQEKADYRLGGIAIGVRRDDPALLEAINSGLDELDKEGVRKNIFEKYGIWDKYQTRDWMMKG